MVLKEWFWKNIVRLSPVVKAQISGNFMEMEMEAYSRHMPYCRHAGIVAAGMALIWCIGWACLL
mgnify:FL=1